MESPMPDDASRTEGPPVPAGAPAAPPSPVPPPAPPPGSLAAYLAKVRRSPPLRFVVELGLLSFALKIAMAVVLGMTGLLPEGKTNTEMMDSRGGTLDLIVIACLVAPLVETAIGQWLPLWIASLFTKRLGPRVAFSAAAFTSMHLNYGLPTTVAAIPVAVILAWGFAVRREISRWEAYWTTSAIHAIHNAISVFSYLLLK
jgi:membrane protease YdiL (CAAX protease family)